MATRSEKEATFREFFGFDAPRDLATIECRTVYNRGLMNGAAGWWMRFTYDKEILTKIIDDGGFTHDTNLVGSVSDDSARPAW